MREKIMDNVGKLRNMTANYLIYKGKILLLYRQGSRVVNNMWTGSAGGHFEGGIADGSKVIFTEMPEF